MTAQLSGTRRQVLTFRARAVHLDRRLPPRAWARAAAVGLQDTPPGSGSLALAARVQDVGHDTWDERRVADRQLVLSWSLRGAPFGRHHDDNDLFTAAACPLDEASWRTLLGWPRRGASAGGTDAADAVARVATEVEAVLQEGPLTKPALSTAVTPRLPEELTPFCRPCGVHHVGEQLLRVSALLGGFVFGADEGDRLTLIRTRDWLGAGRRDRDDGAEARRGLLRRYLRAYGPADAAMVADWLGVTATEGRQRLSELEDELVAVGLDSGTKWLLEGDLEAWVEAGSGGIEGVRLLPPGDPFLQLRDREVLVPDPAVRRALWRPIGNPGVALVDGRAAGVWRPQKRGSRLSVKVELFGRLPTRRRRELEAEAARVATVRGATGVAVEVSP